MLGSSDHVRVRSGRAPDAKALGDIFRRAWLNAYCGIIPHLHLESMIRRRNEGWWHKAIRSADGILVLEVAGGIAGYATCGPARTRGRHKGEIFEIYIDPPYQGLGYGEHLFEGCRHSLDKRGLDGLIVWALAANERAQIFYWGRGGRPVAKGQDRIGGERLPKIAFGWD
jgi:ribosomal protein S18 acetylase RimI-like enzyme